MANELFSKLIHSSALANVEQSALFENGAFTSLAKGKLIFTDDHHMIINGIDYLSRFDGIHDGLVATPVAGNTASAKAGAETLLLGGDGNWYTLDESKYTNSWRAININGSSIGQNALSLSNSTTSAVSLTGADGAYTIDLGAATSTLYGGIKVGYTTDASTGKYAVQLEDGKAYVDLGGNGRYRAIALDNETKVDGATSGPVVLKNVEKSGITVGYNGGFTFGLNVAAADALGGVKIGYTAGADEKRNYAVELNTSNAAYVHVPFVDTVLGTTNTTGNVMTGVTEALSTDGLTRTITPSYATLASLQLAGLPDPKNDSTIGTGLTAADTLGAALVKIENSINAINATATGAMTFQGAVDTIPATGVTNGDTYRLTDNISYPVEAKKGDAVVWVKPSGAAEGNWVVIPAGDEVGYATFTGNSGSSTAGAKEDTIQIVGAAGSVISTSVAQGVITINHANATANTALTDQKESALSVAANGGTFKLPYFTVDGAGHVNGLSEKTFTLSQTWRAISVGGTQLLADTVNTGVNFIATGGATVTGADGTITIGSKYASFKITNATTIASADRVDELKFTDTFKDTDAGIDLMWTEIGENGAVSYF